MSEIKSKHDMSWEVFEMAMSVLGKSTDPVARSEFSTRWEALRAAGDPTAFAAFAEAKNAYLAAAADAAKGETAIKKTGVPFWESTKVPRLKETATTGAFIAALREADKAEAVVAEKKETMKKAWGAFQETVDPSAWKTFHVTVAQATMAAPKEVEVEAKKERVVDSSGSKGKGCLIPLVFILGTGIILLLRNM